MMDLATEDTDRVKSEDIRRNMNMKTVFTMILVIIIGNLFSYSPSFMKQPAVSPDGKMVCFSYMSDLWIVPFEGGEAKRITVSEGDDGRPHYLPDGKKIAFVSDRDGYWGVYIMPAEGGVARLISKEANLNISDWYNDGTRLMGTKFKPMTGTGQYIIHLDGRRIEEITPISNPFSKLSPNEDKIIFNMKGKPYRPAYKGSLAGNLWEYDIGSKSYTQLTFTDTTERYPVYSYANPGTIYYSGSAGEKFQLFRTENYDFENREQLTFFENSSVRMVSIAKANDRIVFENFDKLWRYDPVVGEAEKIEIVIRQDFLGSFDRKESFTDVALNAAISTDGKLIAFSYKYDLFAMPENGGEVKRISYDQKGIGDIVIADDNRTIFFTKRNKGSFELYSVDINDLDNIKKIDWSEGKYIERIYHVSAEKLAIHYRINDDRHRTALMDIKTAKVKDVIEEDPVWSTLLAFTPDLGHVFYVKGDYLKANFYQNRRELKVYDFKTKKSTGLFSRFTHSLDNLYLGKDQKSLFMTLNGELVRLDLVPKPEVKEVKDNWDDILGEKSETAKGRKDKDKIPFRIEHSGIDSRLNTISSRPWLNYVVHVICDTTLYYVNWDFRDNSYSLRRINYQGENDKEIISFSGRINDYQNAFKYNEENNHIYVVVDSKLYKINPNSGQKKMVENKFDYEYNEIELNKSVFDEVWAEFGNNFYDPDMHGSDWNEMYERFSPYLESSYRVSYLSGIVEEMIGELNASHTAFYPRQESSRHQSQFAYIACVLDYSSLLEEGIRIRMVYRGSSLYQKHGIRPGDILLGIDDEDIDPFTAVSPLLKDKTGENIKLKINTSGGVRDVIIKGLTYQEIYDLSLDEWVEHNREVVENLSGNRIGYLYMPQMNYDALTVFKDDLFARNHDKEAVIIDVRGNRGGFIRNFLMDTLTRQAKVYWTSRDYPGMMKNHPGPVWDNPMAVIINEYSYSGGEVFPALFKQEELGIVVGMPTSGSVIGTLNYQLMDGSSVRLPMVGYFTKDKVNLEGTGVQPDIQVDFGPEDRINRNDVQLQKAVEVLLQQLDN